MDTGEPIARIRDRIHERQRLHRRVSRWREALATGANVVIAGRSTDTALALAPMVHRFGWAEDDFDKLAAGTIAGHIIECGAQCTGGNCQVDWQNIPDMANVGYPIVEADPDGSFTVTKHPAAGGRVTLDSVKEQLLYELGDPKNYITPDCVADFTSVRLAADGDESRARQRHSRRPAPALAEAFRSATPTAGRRSARWSIRGRRRWRRRGRPTRSCGSACRISGSPSMKSTPSISESTPVTERRRRPMPIRPKCSCASVCAGRTRRRWTDSRAS